MDGDDAGHNDNDEDVPDLDVLVVRGGRDHGQCLIVELYQHQQSCKAHGAALREGLGRDEERQVRYDQQKRRRNQSRPRVLDPTPLELESECDLTSDDVKCPVGEKVFL